MDDLGLMKTLFSFKLSLAMFHRLSLVTTITVLIVTAGLLAACGDSTPDNGADSTQPPSESRPEPTAQPATATPEPEGVSTSYKEKLFLSADQFDEIEVQLTAGDLLRVVYTSEVTISPGLGGTGHQERGAIMVILDPNEEQQITAEASSDNIVEVTAAFTGTHKIVFINPNQLEGLNVNVEYFVNP